MNFTAFSILIFLWSRPNGVMTPSATLREFAGMPADYDNAIGTLVANGLVQGNVTDGFNLTPGVDATTIVSMASVLTADEQLAVIALMESAGTLPTGDTFLADNRAAGFAAADASRSALFARLAAALRLKKDEIGRAHV